MSLRLAKTGQMIMGEVVWTAETEKYIDLAPGGPWPVGGYVIPGLPIVRQQDTITVDTPDNEEDFTVIIGGRAFTITSDASATVTEIRDALVTAIGTNSALATVAASSTDALILTARNAGVPFSLSVAAGGAGEMSIAKSYAGAALNQFGVVGVFSGRIQVRTPAAFTGKMPLIAIG